MDSETLSPASPGTDGFEWPETLSRFFTYRISVLSRQLAAEGGRHYMQKFNLTMPQWRVISTLGHFRELPVTGIAELVFMDRAQASRTLDSLIERGLVRMRPNTRDRRSTLFSLSHQSEALYDEAIPVAIQRQRDLMDGFAPGDVAVFDRMLDQLLERVNARLSAGRPK